MNSHLWLWGHVRNYSRDLICFLANKMQLLRLLLAEMHGAISGLYNGMFFGLNFIFFAVKHHFFDNIAVKHHWLYSNNPCALICSNRNDGLLLREKSFWLAWWGLSLGFFFAFFTVILYLLKNYYHHRLVTRASDNNLLSPTYHRRRPKPVTMGGFKPVVMMFLQ